MKQRALATAMVLASVSMLLGACGGDDGGGALEIPADAVDLTGQAAVTIDIEDNKFVPRTVVITEGTEVTWVNNGRNDHDVVPDDQQFFERVPHLLASGETATSVVTYLGTIGYYCTLHGRPGRGQFATMIVLAEGVTPQIAAS